MLLLPVLLLCSCLAVISASDVPDPVWPSEWTCETNITVDGQVPDVGTQFYSYSNGAQRVSHSNLFNSGLPAIALWIDDIFYAIYDNYQGCCIYDSFDFPMPSPNWTDYLSYVGKETIIGTECYKYANDDLNSAGYWVSVETGLPVAWINDPGTGPIMQYFTGVDVLPKGETLDAAIFKAPAACDTAVNCDDVFPSARKH